MIRHSRLILDLPCTSSGIRYLFKEPDYFFFFLLENNIQNSRSQAPGILIVMSLVLESLSRKIQRIDILYIIYSLHLSTEGTKMYIFYILKYNLY